MHDTKRLTTNIAHIKRVKATTAIYPHLCASLKSWRETFYLFGECLIKRLLLTPAIYLRLVNGLGRRKIVVSRRFSSFFVVIRKKSLLLVIFRRFSLVFVGFRRFSFVFVAFRRFSSVFVGFHWFSSVFVGFRQFSFVFVGFRRFPLVFVSFCPIMSLYALYAAIFVVNLPISAKICQFTPISANLPRPILALKPYSLRNPKASFSIETILPPEPKA